MPYTSVDQVPANVPEDKKKQWMHVWNSAYDNAKKAGKSDKEAESTAFAEANGVIKKEQKQMSAKREVRFLNNCELRAAEGDAGMQISGYAAVWDSPSQVLGNFFGDGFVERVKRGAFSRALKSGQDVRALFNHDTNQVLGRSANGTLRLSEDDHGLKYEIDLPETQAARDLYALVKRGDVNQSSFGFSIHADGQKRGEEWMDPESGPSERTLTDVDLYDVSPVTFPAYLSSSVSARSLWPDGVPEEISERVPESRKVVHMPGHKDSEGKDAPWVIQQEGTGKILGSFASEEEAKKQLKTIEAIKHEGKSLEDENAELRDENAWLRGELAKRV